MGGKCSTIISTDDRIDMWTKRMLRLAQSSICWEGLPDTIDKVYLEYCLVRNGSAIIIYDDVTDTYWCGQNASVGDLSNYGYPVERSIIFRNGNQLWADVKNSVIIYNNAQRQGDYWYYEMMANDLANIDMAVRVNINSQKTMPIIPTSQQQALSKKNLYTDIEENIPYRLVDENSIDVESFKAALQFDNRKSFTADNMIAVQRELWNRCLTFIGINNVNVEKRERVNTFETNSNLDEIAIMRRDRINSREEACKLLNRKFGWDAKAYYYSDRGGDMVGSLYNASPYDIGKLPSAGQSNNDTGGGVQSTAP